MVVVVKDKICGYFLDNEQEAIVLDDSKYLLVVAGAGSGKTLTILGKINYLLKYKNIDSKEILCISFTKASANSLKEKIKKEFNKDIDVYTFHKLSLEILKSKNLDCSITQPDVLDSIIHEFIYITILNYPKYMKLVLKYFKVRFKNKENYLKFIENNYYKVEQLEKLISTFIHLLKCNGYCLSNFVDFIKEARKNIFNYKFEKRFLLLALNIYIIYQNYLKENNEIDFDDMIINASEVVNESGINHCYKYVIIDEYQDTSFIRFNLIKSILEATNSSLMVVGDDFQSIYRFTGCDLDIFLNFHKYFKEAKIMKIQNTYRNSQELINIAGEFVMKNKSQIYKKLKSNKHLNYPIKIIYYTNIKEIFLKLILKIYQETNNPILVLGRNNQDINYVLDNNYFKINNGEIIYINNTNIKIKYLTAHKSKGLEEENVIIINLENKLLGFPNQISDSKILRFVSKNKEKVPYSEERRLFYVALTRTKNNVYLLVPKQNESIFVKELIKDYKKKIEIIKKSV